MKIKKKKNPFLIFFCNYFFLHVFLFLIVLFFYFFLFTFPPILVNLLCFFLVKDRRFFWQMDFWKPSSSPSKQKAKQYLNLFLHYVLFLKKIYFSVLNIWYNFIDLFVTYREEQVLSWVKLAVAMVSLLILIVALRNCKK